VRPPGRGQATLRPGAKSTKAGTDACGLEANGFALALLLGATTYSSTAYLLLNVGLIPFSPAAVYPAQIPIVLTIIIFARKITAENREKMTERAVVGIDGS
jgi:hypothetical protein